MLKNKEVIIVIAQPRVNLGPEPYLTLNGS